MPAYAVTLVLASCVLHALWNLLLKRAHDKQAFTALFLIAVPVLYLPVMLLAAPAARIPLEGWLCIGVTGSAYAGYFIALAEAYRDGELSVAYPMARSLGPVLALLGGILVLRERPSVLGTVGVVLVLAGALALQRLAQERTRPGRAGRIPSTTAAVLLVALMYGIYSIVDKVAVGRLGLSPITYIWYTYTTAAILVSGWLVRRRALAAVVDEWRRAGSAAVAVAALNPFTYLLVLRAMSLPGTPVSYIVPLRTGSVLVGVMLGVGVLGERRAASKLVAAAAMATGIALIAWRG